MRPTIWFSQVLTGRPRQGPHVQAACAGMGIKHTSASAGVTVLSAARTDQGQNGTAWCDPAISGPASQLRKLAHLEPGVADLSSDFNSFPQLRRKLREITLEGIEVSPGRVMPWLTTQHPKHHVLSTVRVRHTAA